MERIEKGKSIVTFTGDYTVIDLETTGLSPEYDDIIELGAVRVRNGEPVEQFQQLVNPGYPIDEYITELTGITNDMLQEAPKLDAALDDFLSFISADLLVGHNVNFDVNFLYDARMKLHGVPLTNDFTDTMRLSRKLNPELKHHRLKDLVDVYDIEQPTAHRALADCETTCRLFRRLEETALEKYETVDEFYKSFRYHKPKLDLRTIQATTDEFDETHPLFGKVCVFTGALERYTRAEAAQLVVNCGGIVGNGITKKTNFLILGNNDYCSSIKDGKSSKQKKAEFYIQQGCDLMILPEDVFYDMISE